MLLEKFLDTINKFFPNDYLYGKESELASLDLDKIYLENVRSLLDVSSKRAEQICESAVRQGVFSRKIEVLCPDGSAAITANTENELPDSVLCWTEEDGEFVQVKLPTEKLRRLVYYHYNGQ